MKKQFVTYEIALALKELGFDKPCILGLSTLGVSRHKFTSPMTDDDYIRWDKYDTDLPIPLWQQVIDWLREKHGIHIDLDFGLGWGYGFIPVGATVAYDWNHFEDNHNWSYPEAREAAILKAIKIVKGERNE